jgi:phage host-nuclease inhibitor protein Gam
MTPKAQCDALLAELRRLGDELKAADQKMTAEIDAITDRHGPRLEKLHAEIAEREKALRKLGLAHKSTFFQNDDRLKLTAGILLYKRVPWVVRAKGAVAKLKDIARPDLLKITENADWTKIQKEPDTLLDAIGSRREIREKIEYDFLG